MKLSAAIRIGILPAFLLFPFSGNGQGGGVTDSLSLRIASLLELGEEDKGAFIQIIRQSREAIAGIERMDSITSTDRLFLVWDARATREDKLRQLLGEAGYAMFLIYQDETMPKKSGSVDLDRKARNMLRAYKKVSGLEHEEEVLELLQDRQGQIAFIRRQQAGNSVAIRNQLKTLDQETNLRIRDLLSEEQYTGYLEELSRLEGEE